MLYVQGCVKVEEDCVGVDCYYVKDMFIQILFLKIYEWKELIIIFLLRLLYLYLFIELEML